MASRKWWCQSETWAAAPCLRQSLHIMDTYGANVDVHCREVSTIWNSHLFHTVFGKKIFARYSEVPRVHVSVYGSSTILNSCTPRNTPFNIGQRRGIYQSYSLADISLREAEIWPVRKNQNATRKSIIVMVKTRTQQRFATGFAVTRLVFAFEFDFNKYDPKNRVKIELTLNDTCRRLCHWFSLQRCYCRVEQCKIDQNFGSRILWNISYVELEKTPGIRPI